MYSNLLYVLPLYLHPYDPFFFGKKTSVSVIQSLSIIRLNQSNPLDSWLRKPSQRHGRGGRDGSERLCIGAGIVRCVSPQRRRSRESLRLRLRRRSRSRSRSRSRPISALTLFITGSSTSHNISKISNFRLQAAHSRQNQNDI